MKKQTEAKKEFVYGQHEAYLKWGDPTNPEARTYTWSQLGEIFGDVRAKIRSAARYYRQNHPDEFEPIDTPKLVEIEGVTPEDLVPDEASVLNRAKDDFQKVKDVYERKNNQLIKFDDGPIALVWAADHHFGDPGVDVERAFEEAKLIANTPGMWVGLGGDMTNNFIVTKLQFIRNEARMTITDEWVLMKMYIETLMEKILFSMPGNHGGWTKLLSGIDYFANIMDRLCKNALYDKHQVRFTLQVGDWKIPCKARHKWRGSSIYNVTHAIDRSALREGDFLIGFGAHTHTGGYYRTLNVSGENGIALQSGSYKRYDEYPEELGLDRPNKSTAVAVMIVPENRSFTGFDNLQTCADVIRSYYE